MLSIVRLVSESESDESGGRRAGATGGGCVAGELGSVVRGLEVGAVAISHALLWVVSGI